MPKPKRLKPAPTVLAIVGDRTGCTLWRVFQPTKILEDRGYKTWWGEKDHHKLGDAAVPADVIVLPRLSWPTEKREVAANWFRMMRLANKRTVFEVDDDLFTPEFMARQREAGWLDGVDQAKAEEDRLERIWTLQQCDAVTVTCQPLADLIRQYTPVPIHIVPNAIDLPWFRGVLAKFARQVPGLTVGWAGGKRSEGDVEQLAIAWERLAHRYPHVNFVTQGWESQLLQAAVPEPRRYHVPWLPLEDYPAGLVNVDIGCAVVEPSAFNACKTPIKIWEYAAAGIPSVASHELYGPYVRDGRDGLLATTADEWEHQLSRLIENRFLRERLARAAIQRVQQHHSLEVCADTWLDAWTEIWQRPLAKPAWAA